MPFSYIALEEATARPGLRMVVVSNVPSPWGEAAKGIFHIKGIEWSAVRLAYDSEPLKDWAGGQRSGPVAIYDKEKPRSGWAEILLLAERLVPAPSLLPADAADRALVFGLAHELCGEMGLGWSRRLQLIHAGLNGADGFPPRVAQYLGKKYGYTPELGASAAARVAELLRMLTTRLQAQRAQGSRFYVGHALSAVDVYAATFMAMFRPLPEAQCAMDPTTRQAFESQDPTIEAALDTILLAHRDMLYAEHLELPLSL